jgi:hypothetical protein
MHNSESGMAESYSSIAHNSNSSYSSNNDAMACGPLETSIVAILSVIFTELGLP